MVIKQAKVTSKGQVTIPAEVRDALGLREGDTVSFEVANPDQAGPCTVRVVSPFARYAGALREDRGLNAEGVVAELRHDAGGSDNARYQCLRF